ncbi:noggin-3-like [Gasterosteus aculeatus]
MLLFTSSRMSAVGVSEAPRGKPTTHPPVVPSTPKTMTPPFNRVVFVCWISVSVTLRGFASFASNISTQIQATVVQDEEDTDGNSPFVQLRASLLSYSQPVPPYTLLTNAEDYAYMPEPSDRQPSRLLLLLGSSFDLFWMSIEQPSEGHSSLLGKLPNYTAARKKVNSSASPELREAAAMNRQKLAKEAADLDLSSLSSRVASSLRHWLVRSATCGLSYQWVDLGPAFWPRWVRQTDCETSDGLHGCSFPGGMECVRAQTARIKILAWHCLEIRGGDVSRGNTSDSMDGRIEMGTGDVTERCIWRPVLYPVVSACTCSCK